MPAMSDAANDPNPPVADARHRIMLVDDHVLFRTGLRLIMGQNPRISAHVMEAGSVTDALSILRQQERPDLLLLDIVMPGVNGLDGLRLLRQVCPDMRIAVLSAMADVAMEREAQSRGADGFLSKSADSDEIHAALETLLAGHAYFPSLNDAAPATQPAPAISHLTPRQLEVLALMAEGGSNKIIARKLDLSENTVRVHVSAILDHFGVSTRMEAMFAARKHGLIA